MPWGPFGFNSYMYQKPVNRKTAEKLGLVRPGEIIRAIDGGKWGAPFAKKLITNTKVDLKPIPEDIKRQVRADIVAQYGDGVLGKDGKLDLEALTRKVLGK